MNLKNVEKQLRQSLNEKRGLNFEYKYEENYLDVACDITCKSYDDGIYVAMDVYDDGLISISFTFDKLDLSDTALQLINNFNKESVWLTAYVSSKGYLKLRNNIFVGSEKAVVENIDFLLDHFLSDKIKKVLVPLSQLTYPNN